MITQEEVLDWLDTYDDKEVVGRSRYPQSCPIARMVRETHSEVEQVTVNYSGLYVRIDGQLFHYQFNWLYKLLMEIDSEYVSLKKTAGEVRKLLLK